jgi:drug/metabolite transporter (DMT)-like permease
MIVVPYLVLLGSQSRVTHLLRDSFFHTTCVASNGNLGSRRLIKTFETTIQKPLFGNTQNTDSSVVEPPALRASNADRWLGIMVLMTVPLAWGTYTPVVKYLYQIQPPVPGLLFSSAYYTVAAVSLWILLLLQQLNICEANPQILTNTYESSETSASDQITTGIVPTATRFPWKAGIELGSYLFVANVMQVIGLQSVPADRAGFLIQLTTVIVPILEAVLMQTTNQNTDSTSTAIGIFHRIPKRTWIACSLAFLGVIVFDIEISDVAPIFVEESNSWISLPTFSSALQLSTGDSLIIMAAFIYSLHVVRLGRYAKESTALKLATSKATVEAVLSTALILGLTTKIISSSSVLESVATNGWVNCATETGHDINVFITSVFLNFSDTTFLASLGPALGAVLWTGWITCAYTIYAQSFGQNRVQPTDANLIYSMQPLFTAFFAFLLLGEALSPTGIIGATLIAAAVYLVAVPEERSKSNNLAL